MHILRIKKRPPSRLGLSDLRLLDYSAIIVFDGSLTDIDPLEIEQLRTIILSYDGEKVPGIEYKHGAK